MFILMESVWQTGFFQDVIAELQLDLGALPVVMALSIALSQFISNVPLVALFQPVLLHSGAGTEELMALAAGSTIAGNLFILGAASNVIVIQTAERRAKETVTFWEFARVGLPLTALNALVYWAGIMLVSTIIG
jgi:Na+/H+ antiporter NhaD/arsenite permease-like protein